MNLSVSHPLDSRSPFGTFVPPPPAGGVFPDRGGGIERERRCRRGCTERHLRSPLTLKASFVQPLSLASARQPFPFRHLRATSPGRGSLSWQESPWQRGVVLLRLIEVCWKTSWNAKASPYQGRWHRAKRRCRRGCTEQHLRSPLTRKASFVQPLSLASARQLP
mgnify:CR=1 FL=1